LTINKNTFSFQLAFPGQSSAKQSHRTHSSTGSQLLDSFNPSHLDPQPIPVLEAVTEATSEAEIKLEPAKGFDLPASVFDTVFNTVESKVENLAANSTAAQPKTAIQTKTVTTSKTALTARAQATERMAHIVRADRELTGSRQSSLPEPTAK
jgi:hypothetical protein